ncbi:MFS multidrug transporter [Histoplasma ohiense]|nr:MFS multidrug transporter [Histoplasma ohiense (nom. inval.)]
MLYHFIRKKIHARQHPGSTDQKRQCRHEWQNQNQESELGPVRLGNEHDPADAALLSDRYPASEQIQPNGPCQKCKEEKHDARVYRSKLIAGLVFPYFLASVDLTIVASAMPFIASYFNKLDQLNWIVTAFTLTSTAFIPAFGQLADVFGRHFVLQLAMFLMLIGSVFCATAQTWGMLLFGRALQGMSSAGIMNLIVIVLADNVSLKENAKNTTIFQFVSGTSYGVGPVIGGYLTAANWRYCFVLSIPIAFFAHFAIFFLLRKELVKGTHAAKSFSSILSGLATVDLGGTILFILGIGLIILGTSWGGATYPWASVAVLVPLVSGSILFILFFVWEYYLEPGRVLGRVFPQQTPMVPFPMFKVKDTSLLAILTFATGAALYSVFYFIGIYFTLVEAYPSGRAGIQLLFYIPGIGVGVYLAMFACNAWPAQTFAPLSTGTLVESVGVALITWAVTTRNIPLINGMMAVAGAGTGLRFMPSSLHAAGIWPDKLAPAMSIMRFCLPFGGTLALAIMGSVFNNKMASIFHPSSQSQSGRFDIHSGKSLDDINKLPPEVQEHIRNTGKDAVMWAFISIMPIMVISFVSGIFLGNVWIKKKRGESVDQRGQASSTPPADDEENIESNEVVYVSYLWALLTGTLDDKKCITKPLSKAQKQRQAAALLEEKQHRAKLGHNPPDAENYILTSNPHPSKPS